MKQCKKRLRIRVDSKLSFKEHIKSFCKKASQKINALPRPS